MRATAERDMRLEELVVDLEQIRDPRAREGMIRLLNLVEELAGENRRLQTENQQLRDEISRLKSEQGRPMVKPNMPPPSGDISSEKERRKPKQWSKGSKAKRITIDREETRRVDPTALPADAVFKGYEDVVVQDVVFRADTVLFHKEKYYSPSAGKTYLAELPTGYEGQFGPGIKSLVLTLYFGANMSEPKIVELLGSRGIVISAGQVSNLLTKDQAGFHGEKVAIFRAVLGSSPWQVVDETSTRVDGQNEHCDIVCNPLYAVYTTMPGNDRLAVIDALRGERERRFLLNDEALALVVALGLSARRQGELVGLPQGVVLNEAAMNALLTAQLPGLGPGQRKWILDATAVAAYHAELEWPVVRLLVADGAPQFGLVTEDLAQCWVHEGRHYKKLMALVPWHRQLLEGFLRRFWGYYDQLLAYQQQPTPAEAQRLEQEFDRLFATETGYRALDERIAKTRTKKDYLLMVLAHPEIPLHTNAAELGARAWVRKRDVSFGSRTREGAKAWDTFMSLAATARKLGVSLYD
jgi:hypothetical protein